MSIPEAKAQVLLRLKERNRVQSLFRSKPISRSGLLLFCDQRPTFHCAVSVGVPKRWFRKAVDRNRIKRMMREALREIHLKRGVFPFSSAMILYSSSNHPLMTDLTLGIDRLIALAEEAAERKDRKKDIE